MIGDCKNLKDKTTVYHYCDFMEVKSTSPVAILRSLFIQILLLSGTDWLEDFSDLVKRKEQREGPPAGFSHLTDLIARASVYHNQVLIIIDALDECRDKEGFLKLLPELHQRHGIAVFVTSRKEQDIQDAFSMLPFISLQDCRSNITTDMQTHVSSELQNRTKLSRLPIHLREEILDTLLKKSEGM